MKPRRCRARIVDQQVWNDLDEAWRRVRGAPSSETGAKLNEYGILEVAFCNSG